jgi:DegV family protein with EDD domain
MDPQTVPLVITDSASQLLPEEASKLGIEVVPLAIYVNGKEYLDGIDITPSDLYQKMRTEQLEVNTAAPGVGQFYERFKKIFEQGGRAILCVMLSSQLSSAYNSAVDAANMIRAEYPAQKVLVFDSLTAAVAQGFLAIEAAKRLREGEDLESVFNFLNSARQKAGLIAVVETLKYLAQGGRIGKAAYLFGSALQIVPILTVNDEGVVAPASIIRKKGNIIPTMLSILKKQTGENSKIRISVMHADALEQAKILKQSLLGLYPGSSIAIEEFTPVMGAHTGPGLFGLGYLVDSDL